MNSTDDPPCPFYLEMFDPRFDNHLTLRSAVTRKRGLILTGYAAIPWLSRSSPRQSDAALTDPSIRHCRRLYDVSIFVQTERILRLLIIHRGIDNDSIVNPFVAREGREIYLLYPNSNDNSFIRFDVFSRKSA